jgi:hypothetical protein
MAFDFKNLDERTREMMLDELERDIQAGAVYMSPRLSSRGELDYIGLLREAIQLHTESWLADQLRSSSRLNDSESRKTKTGVSTVRVPISAPWTLAEGEFNRYYVRGVCRRAIEEGLDQVIAYRAQPVEKPRPQSQSLIGQRFNPQQLLEDLRRSAGVEPALGLPPGPNSGLSIRLP